MKESSDLGKGLLVFQVNDQREQIMQKIEKAGMRLPERPLLTKVV